MSYSWSYHPTLNVFCSTVLWTTQKTENLQTTLYAKIWLIQRLGVKGYLTTKTTTATTMNSKNKNNITTANKLYINHSLPRQTVIILPHNEFDDKILAHPTIHRCLGESKEQKHSFQKIVNSEQRTHKNFIPFGSSQCNVCSSVETKTLQFTTDNEKQIAKKRLACKWHRKWYLSQSIKPMCFVLTQERIMISFSPPWNASTVDIYTEKCS